MSQQDEKRAQIIAAQAQREALAKPLGTPKKKGRSNWAASPPVGPSGRFPMRRGGPPGDKK